LNDDPLGNKELNGAYSQKLFGPTGRPFKTGVGISKAP